MSILLAVIIAVPSTLTALTAIALHHVRAERRMDAEEDGDSVRSDEAEFVGLPKFLISDHSPTGRCPLCNANPTHWVLFDAASCSDQSKGPTKPKSVTWKGNPALIQKCFGCANKWLIVAAL